MFKMFSSCLHYPPTTHEAYGCFFIQSQMWWDQTFEEMKNNTLDNVILFSHTSGCIALCIFLKLKLREGNYIIKIRRMEIMDWKS